MKKRREIWLKWYVNKLFICIVDYYIKEKNFMVVFIRVLHYIHIISATIYNKLLLMLKIKKNTTMCCDYKYHIHRR